MMMMMMMMMVMMVMWLYGGRSKRHGGDWTTATHSTETGHVIQGPFIVSDSDATDGTVGPVITSDRQMISVIYRTATDGISHVH